MDTQLHWLSIDEAYLFVLAPVETLPTSITGFLDHLELEHNHLYHYLLVTLSTDL